MLLAGGRLAVPTETIGRCVGLMVTVAWPCPIKFAGTVGAINRFIHHHLTTAQPDKCLEYSILAVSDVGCSV